MSVFDVTKTILMQHPTKHAHHRERFDGNGGAIGADAGL
jgi:hypothetical protein